MAAAYVQPRLEERVLAELDARAEPGSEDSRVTHGRSSVVREMLDDYLALLAHTRRELRRRQLFSDGELSALVDALNGLKHTPGIIGELAINIEDALPDGIAEKWSIDGKALVEKLQALTPTEEITILDAAARWWNRVAAGEENLLRSELLR